jgi:hypothetical protein
MTTTVPEDLARDAEEFGTLDSNIIVSLLRAETDRRISDFVNAEIKAHRQEKADKASVASRKLQNCG